MVSSEPGSWPRSGTQSSATISSSSFFEFVLRARTAVHRRVLRIFDSAIEPLTKAAGVPDQRAAQFDHLALNLPDEEALHALRSRLRGAGFEVTDIVDRGTVRSVYFTDPTGIALEASRWVLDPTGRFADYGDDRFFADADPVPAVQELQTTGGLTSVPSNRRS
jgi:glyoxalase/bleomycin resistance protein/dioxygenase superfamily protein